MPSRQTCAVLASSLALAAGVLAGCSGDDPAPSGDPSESTPDASEQTGEEGVVSEDGGSEVTTYQSIPPGFPEEVPILDESEATGSVTEYDNLTGYSVVMESDEDVRPTLQEAVTLVADEGFEGETEVPPGDDPPPPVVLNREDPEITVVMTGVAVDGGSLLTYTVEVS